MMCSFVQKCRQRGEDESSRQQWIQVVHCVWDHFAQFFFIGLKCLCFVWLHSSVPLWFHCVCTQWRQNRFLVWSSVCWGGGSHPGSIRKNGSNNLRRHVNNEQKMIESGINAITGMNPSFSLLLLSEWERSQVDFLPSNALASSWLGRAAHNVVFPLSYTTVQVFALRCAAKDDHVFPNAQLVDVTHIFHWKSGF